MGETGTTAAQLEAWVRAELSLPGEAVVGISEKPGSDPRCAEMITEVAVRGPGDDAWSFHIETSLAEAGPMDVVAALAFGGGH